MTLRVLCALRVFNLMTQHSPTTFRTHALNIGLLVLALVALYWQVFFLGKTIIDVNTLNNQLPWGYGANENVNHPYNRRDPTDMYLTREYFIVAAYADGELPLWNPYTFTGHPIYADGVTRIFSPSLLFYTFLDLPVGYSVARLAELMLGAIFMYLFLIAIGVSPRGALLGALVFELSAHSLFHLTGLGWWGGLMWLPLILLFVDRALTRNQFKYAILAGIFLAAQFFCAYMPNQIYYLGTVVLYYLVFGWQVKNRFPAANVQKLSTLRLFAMLGITLAIGFTLSATQWLPVMELLGFSNRRIVPTESGYIYLPPWYIVTLIFPNLFGTAYDSKMVNLFTALNVSHDHSLYLSMAALLPLGFLIHRFIKRSRIGRSLSQKVEINGSEKSALQNEIDPRIPFFLFFLALALVVMMAAPLYVHVTRFLPVLQTIRVIVRAGVMFIFAASVLIAFGTDLLLKAGPEEMNRFARITKRFLFATLALVALGIVVTYGLKLSGFVSEANAEYFAGSGRLAYLKSVSAALASQLAPPQASILIPLLFLFAGYGLLGLLNHSKISHKVFFAGLVTLLIGDLFINSLQYDKTHEAARVFPKTEITEKLKSLPPGRVLVAPSGIETNRRAHLQDEKVIAPPNTLLAYKIPTVTGKDQLFPKSYREFCSLIEAQDRLSHVVFDETVSPYFDLLNVRYLITSDSAPTPANHELILKAEGIALYENRNVMARAFFVETLVYTGSASETLKILRDSGYKIRNTAFTENPLRAGYTNTVDSYSIDHAKANIIEDKRNRVVIETDNAGDGLLVLSDNDYPGWQATIDDKPAEILRTNYTMRAVRVPAGRHMVSFSFAPKSFTMSIYISLVAWVIVLALLSVMQLHKMKNNKTRNPQEA
jgi:hypothetical protein